MKRILSLAVISLIIGMIQAAPVDPSAAADIARSFATSRVSKGRMAPMRTDVQLIHTEYGPSSSTQAVYYIFNTSDSYYIVSGDDRAREVLAHGDAPLDMNKIPDNMRFWLTSYREQLDFLLSHPDIVVQKPRRAPARAIYSVEPLLASRWDQGYPYNLECPEVNGARCVTGCGATSLAMIFHYWKFPTEETPTVPAYTTYTHKLSLGALEPTTFDWDNMLNIYNRFTGEQATAVAHLMRYIGQCERMDYSPGGSATTAQDVLRTIKFFGYDDNASIKNKTNWWGSQVYTDEQWGNLIQEELDNGRPVLMCAQAQDPDGLSGHAFDIDGYDATDDTYHINWGWGGYGDANYALNAFGYNGSVFNISQQIITGIEPKITEPTIRAGASAINIEAYEDSVFSQHITVRGILLSDDITLVLNDNNGVYSIDRDRITGDNINRTNRINLTFSPKVVGNYNATLTISSNGAEDVVINLNGVCLLETHDPYSLEAFGTEDNHYTIQWKDNPPGRNVSGYELNYAPIPFYELRMSENFDNNPNEGTSTTDYSSKLDEITELPGWTGSKVYRSGSDLILGTSKSKGWLETPALDMFNNQGKVTVKVTVKSSGTTPSALFNVSSGSSDTTFTITNNDSTYVVLLSCPASGEAKIRFNSFTGKRVTICDVAIYAGDDYSPVDESLITSINGITEKSYQFDNLSPGFYALRVQTHYNNGDVSQWTPWLPLIVEWNRFDTNRDGEINIADINQVMDVIFMEHIYPSFLNANDVNRDGEINLSDINMIIDKILSD